MTKAPRLKSELERGGPRKNQFLESQLLKDERRRLVQKTARELQDKGLRANIQDQT